MNMIIFLLFVCLICETRVKDSQGTYFSKAITPWGEEGGLSCWGVCLGFTLIELFNQDSQYLVQSKELYTNNRLVNR